MRATGGLVNHTCQPHLGTELLLDVTGLDAGATDAVVYRLLDGTTVAAGSLRGVADVVLKCRVNALPCELRSPESSSAARPGRPS